MNTNQIEAVILDLGGVLIQLNYQLTIDAFLELGLSDPQLFYSQSEQSSLFDQYETGVISTQRFINEILPFLKPGTTPNQVVRAWNAMILDFPIEIVSFLKELGSKYPLYLLSNTNEIHYQKVIAAWKKVSEEDFHSLFHHVYLSHEIQLRKPNLEIFDYVCRTAKLNRNHTLFIDDSIQHIEGALSYGLQAVHLPKELNLQSIFS